jgi:hypothetical protein
MVTVVTVALGGIQVGWLMICKGASSKARTAFGTDGVVRPCRRPMATRKNNRIIASCSRPVCRHAGECRYPRLLFVAAKEVVDTGLRRHDEVGADSAPA